MIFDVHMKRKNKIEEAGSRASQFQGAVMPAHSKRRMGTDDSNAEIRSRISQESVKLLVKSVWATGVAGASDRSGLDAGNRRKYLIPRLSAAIRAVFL